MLCGYLWWVFFSNCSKSPKHFPICLLKQFTYECTSVFKFTSFKSKMYCIIYLKVKRIDLRCYHCTHTHTHTKCSYVREWTLINIIVAIISQYVSVSNHHIAYLKPTYVIFQYYLNWEVWDMAFDLGNQL